MADVTKPSEPMSIPGREPSMDIERLGSMESRGSFDTKRDSIDSQRSVSFDSSERRDPRKIGLKKLFSLDGHKVWSASMETEPYTSWYSA
eukprot:jgi/Chrzof1/5932/Cz16g21020.t1